MSRPATIERRHQLSADELRTAYIDTGTPVILTGLQEDWPAATRWHDPAYLKDKAGHVTVPLTPLPGAGGHYFGIEARPTLFAEALDLMFGEANPETLYYVPQVELAEEAPALLDDFAFPYPGLDHHARPPSFWIGSGGSVSRLHFDLPNNFLAQVRGQKHFYLVPPEQSHRVYPPPPYDAKPHFSPLRIGEAADPARYPLFARVRPLEATVSAGEVLFVPSMWWHQVTSVGQGLAVNWFWNTSAMEADQSRLGGCLGALAQGQVEASIALAHDFEAPNTRSALLGAIARTCLAQGDRLTAEALWRSLDDARWHDALAELFEGIPA